ncbi:DNA polymerase IV [Coprinopsis cinerea okayama7|uniref:DNA polymerase kappa n=2 Tax=Coprinopsis cinerea TaxID=5346 RepID=D6RLC7_COPC7|nr:DNA polymerase IV [Coprinopsis cinerea okayama7\|eukprot:XP_002911648.1 DNA polymerase IV [Coprinopsis cinerea okayama7\
MTSTGSFPEPSQQSESLTRRLAGPSVTKAGLAHDQTEINRIILEASKGSKFYENEKRKDKELTEKINRILQEKEEAMLGADMAKLEAMADQQIMKLESERDLSQFIVHVDMDAFYANVEILRDPSLKGKPFAVGRGVMSTASYEARKYGVRSGMAGFIGKKLCPQLIFVPAHFDLYSKTSAQIMSIFRRYDPTMCPAGVDEAYLNVTAYCKQHGKTVDEVVSEMRKAVFDETQLTVSAGIAPNKMLAKICSDKNKPNGQFKLEFEPDSIKAFMHSLSIRKVPGVGRVNERLLDSIGIRTCGDIYQQRGVIALMDKRFGLDFLLRVYLGIASNHVAPHAREERKSIGAERTFSTLDSNHADPKKGSVAIVAKLEEVAEELVEDMKREGWVGKTVTLKYKLDTYQTFTRAKQFSKWITTKEELFNTGKELLLSRFPLRLRLIGLRLTRLKDLRAESKSTGIKRFFEPIKQQQDRDDAHGPRKRRRLDPELEEADDEPPGSQDCMPGFHEHDERDIELAAFDDDGFEEEGFAIVEDPKSISHTPKHGPGKDPKRPRPPVSAPACSPPNHIPPQTDQAPVRTRAISIGPISESAGRDGVFLPPPPEEPPEQDLQECPICGRKLRTDNQGLNSHIDFCLSRDAIWDAQTETVQSAGRSGHARANSEDRDGKRITAHLGKSSHKRPTGAKGKNASTGSRQGVLQWVKQESRKK